MTTHHRSFGIGESARFVENFGRHFELADVVDQSGPVELVPFIIGQVHFDRNHVGVGPHPFGVPAGLAIMATQLGDQFEHVLGGALRRSLVECTVLQPSGEVSGGAVFQCDPKP